MNMARQIVTNSPIKAKMKNVNVWKEEIALDIFAAT